MATPKRVLDQKHNEFVTFCREYPHLAAELLLVRNNKPLKLTWYQRKTLFDAWNGQFAMLIWARALGKSFMLAVFSVLKAWFYPNHQVIIIASSYRQAQKVFDEIIRLYNESPLLQRSCIKPPSKSPIQCELIFNHGSRIIALPIGDGNKIRGARAQTIVADEVAHIPSNVIDVVILPMLNVSADPWARNTIGNSILFASTAYYQFNHLYQRYQYFLKKTNPNSPEYDESYKLSVYDIFDAPPGWLDLKVIRQQRVSMTKLEWLMENMSIFPKDSGGWYSASLVDSVREYGTRVKLKGDRGKQYVMGIDPARHGDNFAIAVLELGEEKDKLVYCNTLKRDKTLQAQVKLIRDVLRNFNIVHAVMDKGGGGTWIRDKLTEPYNYYNPETDTWVKEEPILDMDFEEHRNLQGRKILQTLQFQAKDNTEANSYLRAQMENKKISIPRAMTNEENKNLTNKDLQDEEIIFNEIEEMVKEIISIEATPLKGGFMNFDTPTRSKKKDRFSAFLLASVAAKKYREMGNKRIADTLPIGFAIEGVPWSGGMMAYV